MFQQESPQSSETASTELQAFVLGLGRALVLANAPVGETQERLASVTARNGIPDARVVVFATTLMLAFGQAGTATIEIIPQFDGGLRLDQISALYDLVDRAERGEVTPADGLRQLEAIREMRPRHGRAVAVVSYVAMTIGICLVLQPTPGDLAVSAIWGCWWECSF